MRLVILLCGFLLLSCNAQTTHRKISYADSLKKSDSIVHVNDKELSRSLNAINLESYFNKVKYSADFDSLDRKKLFLGHVYIIDILRVNKEFIIKGSSDQVLPHYTFDLLSDSADAKFIGQNSSISLEFSCYRIQKILRDTLSPLSNNILPMYHISGRVVKAVKPLP